MRVHLHTNQPAIIREILTDWGEIRSFEVHDLIVQQREALELQQATKIALVTDSSCDLPPELMTKYHINIVPVRIHFGNESFLDKQTITPLEFYEKLKTSPIHPTTSQPTPANFKEVYENLAARYDTIISIHLSGSLSGTFRAAQTAANLINNTRMVLIDSKTTSIALGLLLLEAGEAIAARVSVEKITENLENILQKIKIIINMPSLKYLIRGGRIKRGKGLIATILNIKPLLTFNAAGSIQECGKAFGNYFAIRKTVKKVKTDLRNLKNARIGIVHANAIAKAEWLRKQFADLPSVREIIIHDVAPVLGVHAGPGTVGVAYWGEE
jgi:DegV family protein with EDD domain